MNTLNYVIEWTMKDGKADDFKKTATWIAEQVQAKEPGTKNYQWYFSADGTKCYLHETFDNSAGLVAHAAGPTVQGHLPELLASSDITRFEVYGNPDAAATEVLDGFGASVHNQYTGFTR